MSTHIRGLRAVLIAGAVAAPFLAPVAASAASTPTPTPTPGMHSHLQQMGGTNTGGSTISDSTTSNGGSSGANGSSGSSGGQSSKMPVGGAATGSGATQNGASGELPALGAGLLAASAVSWRVARRRTVRAAHNR